mmetsp:Transcript_6631/g.10015  ORF Transcript_6631/g.10015 Transcript_6631/m.10015 type:complete len:388 (+) Transcript_6631:98-1261(+)
MSEFEDQKISGEEEKEEDTTLANSDVTTKYQEAAKIVNSTLTEIIAMCVPGATVLDICKAGDAAIVTKCDAIYRPKKGRKPVEKGVAFPVCLSVNECLCHFSPLESDTPVVLAAGDSVKIDLGCHVDGYIAVAAHTVIVPGDAPVTVTGPQADCLNAAYIAAEVAARLITPGNTNKQVSEGVKAVGDAYGVQAVAGTVMHQMKRYVIDASKVIMLREEGEQKAEECTFEANEVYAVDVAMSTGEGKPRDMDTRTTVYKRNVDRTYNLKMKASRAMFSEISKKFPTLPFSLRSLEDERQAKLGVRELVQHELIAPYPVLYERADDHVVHVKFTVLLLPSGTTKITGMSLPEGMALSEGKTLPEDIQNLLAAENKKKKKSKKKKATGDA